MSEHGIHTQLKKECSLWVWQAYIAMIELAITNETYEYADRLKTNIPQC